MYIQKVKNVKKRCWRQRIQPLPTSHLILLLNGLLKSLHVALASVQSSSGDVHAHGVDAHVVCGVRRRRRDKEANDAEDGKNNSHCYAMHPDYHLIFKLTNIVSLIEHHHGALGQFFGNQVGNLWVQQVMVAVHHDVSMQDLRGGKCKKRITY